jgi:NAD(P)-dependent dehydrogenase (short-subunit alcohol dehydrogenase family)
MLKKFSLKNKTIILTGSAGRVGSRFSEILSEAGANLILIDRNEEANEKLYKKIKKQFKTNCLISNTDITNAKEIDKLIKIILKKYSKIDVLINNAHFIPRDHPNRDASFEKYPYELWQKAISENLNSVFVCCQKFGKIMAKQKNGSIINISSIYGIVAPDQRIYGKSRLNSPPFYSATKGATVNLTKYLASYWGNKNVRVNTLTLGGVFDNKLHTDKGFVKEYSKRTMLGRMSKVTDYDGAILFLSSDLSSYMTGANLIIDGGWTAW